MCFLGNKIWRVIWDGGVQKDCVSTSLKYDGFGPYLVTMISSYKGQCTDYYNDKRSKL